jgi:hypothetical protein
MKFLIQISHELIMFTSINMRHEDGRLFFTLQTAGLA